MRLILFLGAGVSLPSGLPTAAKLTELLVHQNRSASSYSLPRFPQQQTSPDVVARVPPFLRLLKEYDDADIKRIGYTRLGGSEEYTSTGAIFRAGGSSYEDLFHLCQQIKYWGRGWSDNCMTTPLMEALDRLGNGLFRGNSAEARLADVCSVGEAAFDYIQSMIIDLLDAHEPVGLHLVIDLARSPEIDELNIVTLNHDTLVEQTLDDQGIPFVNGFGERDGDVRWYDDAQFDTASEKVRLFKLHGSIDWGQIWSKERKGTAMRIVGDFRTAADAAGRRLELTGSAFLSGQDKAISYQRGIFANLHHRFHELLRTSHAMVMSGYSWGDHAINCRLETWLDVPQHNNRLVLLHPNPDELKCRSLIVVTSFDGWIARRSLIPVTKWLCDAQLPDVLPHFETCNAR